VNRNSIPRAFLISKSQIVVHAMRGRAEVVMIFRDSERGDRVSFAMSTESVGMWEPSYDPVVWQRGRSTF